MAAAGGGRDRVGDLSFQPMLARVYGDSVRSAFLDYFAGPNRGGLFRRNTVREDRLGAVLPAYQRRRIAGPHSVPVDRTARRFQQEPTQFRPHNYGYRVAPRSPLPTHANLRLTQ